MYTHEIDPIKQNKQKETNWKTLSHMIGLLKWTCPIREEKTFRLQEFLINNISGPILSSDFC